MDQLNLTYSEIKYHIFWFTHNRKHVLDKQIKPRVKELILQGCESMDIEILGGKTGSNYVYIHIKTPPTLSPSEILKALKGRSSKKLRDEFEYLKASLPDKVLWKKGYSCYSSGEYDPEQILQMIKDDDN